MRPGRLTYVEVPRVMSAARLIVCFSDKRENVSLKYACDPRLLRYFCVVAIVTMTRRSTCGSTLGSAGRFEPPYATRGLPAYAVRAAPSHVVGAHSTESAPLLPDGGTGHNSLETWLALLGRLGQQAGQLMSRGQANNEAAAQHRVNLAV